MALWSCVVSGSIPGSRPIKGSDFVKDSVRKVKGKVSRFWKSYSVFLTFCLVSVLAVSAVSATKYSIENGLIKVQSTFGNSWENYSFGASSPSSGTESQFQKAWSGFAEDTGMALASSGGGLTLSELRTGLEEYVGKRVSSYFFRAALGQLASVTVSDLYEAIALNQQYTTMPLYNTIVGNYLRADGSLASDDSSGQSIANLIREGFAGMRVAFIGKASTPSFTISIYDIAHQSQQLRGATSMAGAFGSAALAVTTNQNQIYLLEQQMLEMQQQIKELNEQWYTVLNSSLVGSGSASYTPWDSTTGQPAEEAVTYDNILQAITELGGTLQNDLAKLRYVLASDQDIEITDKISPVKDSVVDSFTGESGAAVKADDVGDMAGFSSDIQGALNIGANASDAVGALSSGAGWGFWSQETANDLHNVPSSASVDEDDFVHFYDPSIIDAYLSGGES